jgi:hypothetical protein
VKVRSMDMLTRLGWVRLGRWQVVERERGDHSCPVDKVLGLAPRQHASPWVQEEPVTLATRIPYRQAKAILTGLLAAPLDHRTLYAWVQQAGAAVVQEEDDCQEAVFGCGERPATNPGCERSWSRKWMGPS